MISPLDPSKNHQRPHCTRARRLAKRLARSLVVLAGTLSGGLAAANASATDSLTVALVDARADARKATLYADAPTALRRRSRWRVIRLAPHPAATLPCCAVIAGKARQSDDLPIQGPTGTTAAQQATALLPTARAVPFLGIALPAHEGKAITKASHPDGHALTVKQGNKRPAIVLYCVTGETFHLRVVDARSGREAQRFALPLGMDVEPDCTEAIMPALPGK